MMRVYARFCACGTGSTHASERGKSGSHPGLTVSAPCVRHGLDACVERAGPGGRALVRP
jgi:hypothetical protein